MRLNIKFLLLLIVIIYGCSGNQNPEVKYSGIDYTNYVDPFIGTHDSRPLLFPGMVPRGIIIQIRL